MKETDAAQGGETAEQLVVEPFGGMAGDMFLAAALDLDDPRFSLDDLRAFASAVVPGEASFGTKRVWRGSLSGTHLSVVTPESERAPHRGLADLLGRVDGAPLSDRAKAFAARALRRIAEAEGRVHDCAPDEVHFHEVGAVDTIVDVGGAALALDRLGVERAAVLPPLVGSGEVECAHGTMPVPAPATAEILRGLPVRSGGGGERCTPTGAAILVELAALGRGAGPPRFGPIAAAWVAQRIGYGAGTRDPREGPPNLVRVQLGAADPTVGTVALEMGALEDRPAEGGAVDELRVNLDDMTPEAIGALVMELREAGALEVWTSAVAMKKDRPGALVTALVRSVRREALVRVLFERSSTFGVRWSRVARIESARRTETIDVAGVPVRVKVRTRPAYEGRSPDDERDLFCEHDDVVRLARERGLPLREAHALALRAARASAPRADLGGCPPGDAGEPLSGEAPPR